MVKDEHWREWVAQTTHRTGGRGLITVCNHESVFDDPVCHVAADRDQRYDPVGVIVGNVALECRISTVEDAVGNLRPRCML